MEEARGMFHILPPIAALVIFSLFAFDGQIHEIYLSYLEALKLGQAQAMAALLFAALGLALLSALLFRAEYWLTDSRSLVILSDHRSPDVETLGARLRRTTAVALALAPWMGVAVGLFSVKFYLDGMAQRFADMRASGVSDVPSMAHYLPQAGSFLIAITAIILGLANAVFIRRQDNILRHVIVATTPVAALCMFILVTDYLPTDPSRTFIAFGVVAIVGICGAHYLLCRRLHASGRYVRISRGRGQFLQRHHRALLLSTLILPWALIALYFLIGEIVGSALRLPPPGPWSALGIAMCGAIIVGLCVAQALDDRRDAPALHPAVVFIVLVLAVAAWLLPFLANPEKVVRVYRFIGPIGTTTLALACVLSIVVLLAWLSRKSKLPALSMVVLTIVGIALWPWSTWIPVGVILLFCLIIGSGALLSEVYAVAGAAAVIAFAALIMGREASLVEPVKLHPDMSHYPPADVAAYSAGTGTSVCQRFQNWLKSKNWVDAPQNTNVSTCPGPAAHPDATKPHHVAFLVAVEGGGIYAGSAASLFLARLQDAKPAFSDHVFAISGVSGGAIGAAVFGVLDAQAQPSDQTPLSPPYRAENGCALDQSGSAVTLCAKVARIFETDHYSPLVGSVFPELFASAARRADALAESFALATADQDSKAGATIEAPFADYWADGNHLPALLLNATWAENGSRLAFAPFPLHDIDELLHSFADDDMPPLTGAVAAQAKLEGAPISLIQAAVVSARFPGLLSPFSLMVDPALGPNSTSAKLLRWNFVDGGYSDSSGAATVLALYQALDGIAEQNGVELQVILLTSAKPTPNIAETSGTSFRDTLAPIDAILTVRQAASNAAVARACNLFYPQVKTIASQQSISCESHAGNSGAALQLVEIEDTTYGLSLGWEISHTTYDVIAWSLGTYDPHACDNYRTSKAEPAVTSQLRNTCVFTSIVDSLNRKEAGKR